MVNKKLSPATKSLIFSYSIVIVAGVFQALSLYFFILPHRFSPGGVTGIATAVQYLTGDKINSGYLVFALNVPLLIAAWFFFKKEYVIKTAMSIALTSSLLVLLPAIDCPVPVLDPFLAALAGGVISGVALGILFKYNGSNGGSEIIGGFIQKKFPEYNIAWFIFAIDMSVVLATAFIVADENTIQIIILSIIKMFVSSKLCSTLLEGFNAAIKFEVITEHPHDIGREIISEVGRGVTQMTAKGVYSGKEKAVLVCVVRKRQIGAFQRVLKKYPETFAYIMNTKEVYGTGFSVPNAIKPQMPPPIPGQNYQDAPPIVVPEIDALCESSTPCGKGCEYCSKNAENDTVSGFADVPPFAEKNKD